MAINEAAKAVLKALSYAHLDLPAARRFAEIKSFDPLKGLYKTIDHKFLNGDHEVLTRIYIPEKCPDCGCNMENNTLPVMLFCHGGGFVTESVDTYNRTCRNLANSTGQVVVSVDYRLAPESRFPIGLEDCYAVAKAIFCERGILSVDPCNITLIGDSAGGNITAALCQMARDRGEFMPRRQILIYPCVDNDYSENSKYPSVTENGTDYLLTRRDMQEYMDLYKTCDADFDNPYFSPIKAENFTDLPRTLLITAEFDPLRDEGEAYAYRLLQAGVKVEMHRIPDSLHGFFAMNASYKPVKQCISYINGFLKEDDSDASNKKSEMAQA